MKNLSKLEQKQTQPWSLYKHFYTVGSTMETNTQNKETNLNGREKERTKKKMTKNIMETNF